MSTSILPVPTQEAINAAMAEAGISEIEPNPPGWKMTAIANQQVTLDNNYRDAVGRYNQAATQWMVDAQESQASGKPLPVFQPKPPVREILYPSRTPVWFQVDATDPEIKPPTVPPFTSTPNKGTPISTGAGAQTDMVNGMLAQIVNDLGVIMNDLWAIKKALGIK